MHVREADGGAHRRARDEDPAPGSRARLDHAAGLEQAHRLVDRRDRDAEALAQLLLGGDPIAGLAPIAADPRLELLREACGARDARRQWLGRCRRHYLNHNVAQTMDLELEGRVALVTGAGSGIGLATARALLAEGAAVVAADLDPSAAIADAPVERLLPFTVDLSSPHGPTSAVAFAIEQLGTIDVLVNNVGVCPHRDGFLDVADESWKELLELNFFSMVRCCRAAIPRMLDQGRGSIISLSSDAGHMPGPYFVDYAVTKGMIRLLSKALANEFAGRGIRSNTVSPGPTRTAPVGDRRVHGRDGRRVGHRPRSRDRTLRPRRPRHAARAPRRPRGRRRGDRLPRLRSRGPDHRLRLPRRWRRDRDDLT